MSRVRDGVELFDCLLCRDTGCVIVVDPRSVARIRAGHGQAMVDAPGGNPLYTGATRCTCKHGAHSNSMSDYDSYHFCITGDDWGCISIAWQVARVEEWLANRRPSNYAEEFDQFQ